LLPVLPVLGHLDPGPELVALGEGALLP
jgi:hypothetical protein